MKNRKTRAPKFVHQLEDILAKWSVPLALAIIAILVITIGIPISIDIYQYWGSIEAKERAKAGIELIKFVATVVGGVAILWNIIIARRQLVATQEQNITDRFSKAVEQLGHDSTSVRIGGIYALARIAQDSPRDHWTIVEVLTAFVRDQRGLGGQGFSTQPTKFNKDIQSAISVIGRRNTSYDPPKASLYLNYNDLRGLAFFETDYSNAYFHGSDLREVNFSRANLQNCNLWQACLTQAKLCQTNLQDAYLVGTDLREANLEECVLKGADLQQANLEAAKGLTVEQVKAAENWQDAIYSPEFAAQLGLNAGAPNA